MKESKWSATHIRALSLLLQLSTLCFHPRGAVRTPRPANPKLNRRRAAFCLATLIAGFGLMPAGRVTAQTFTVLHNFTATKHNGSCCLTNSDGSYPAGRLIANSSGNTLYGTADLGGSLGYGTVFAVNTDGTGFTTLHSFIGFTNGSQPLAGVILSGNTLYGTTWQGGTGNGAVFKVNIDGTGFTTLHIFTARSGPDGINSDGAKPRSGLILSSNGNTLYGTAEYGGSLGYGTVFKVNTNGTGFTTLHNFTATFEPYSTNSDGTHPNAGVILSGNTLYGTAPYGGGFGQGTVFKVNTDGTGFTTLHSFGNTDGAYPEAELLLSGNTLYGTTTGGGSVFAIHTNGTGFTNLYAGGGQDGLVLLGNSLYGVARGGGSLGNGTVFSLSFAPQLNINRSEANVILTWPTNVAGFDYSGFTLQSTTNLVSPAVWSTNSPAPVVVNGQHTVTNPVSETQKFFRLKSP